MLGAIAAACLVAAPSGEALGQTSPQDAVWMLFVDGRRAEAPDRLRALPPDSLQAASRSVLEALQGQGYYLARVDSARVERAAGERPAVLLFATEGPSIQVGEVRLEGVGALDEALLRASLDTRPGRRLLPERLEADLDALLGAYDAAGFPFASVEVAEVTLTKTAPPALVVVISVTEGPSPFLEGIELLGASRTRPDYALRVAGLQAGHALMPYEPEALRRRLEATGLFEHVGAPELVLRPDGRAVVRVGVREATPGQFDLVLGYIPRSGGRGGGVVGNGHLLLRNLFGRGRRLGLRLNRLPGLVSSVDVMAGDPYIAGWPVGIEARFAGLQQDSTFSRQRYRAALTLQVREGLSLVGALSREQTRPGPAGQRLVAGRQRIARADALLASLGVRYVSVDQPTSPRRGVQMALSLARGRQERRERIDLGEGASTRVGAQRVERLEAEMRGYLSTAARQVLVGGGEGGVLLSEANDAADLFRLGGARSLRGYDEDRFLGRIVGRALVEYRYLIDRLSFAYLFFDLGYVDAPSLGERLPLRRFYPGYGFGMQFSSPLGLINASYAANPEDGPANGRVHVGLGVGL